MSLKTLTLEYLAALKRESTFDADRKVAADAAREAGAEADTLKVRVLAEAQGGEKFVLHDQLVSIDSGIITVEAVVDLGLVQRTTQTRIEE